MGAVSTADYEKRNIKVQKEINIYGKVKLVLQIGRIFLSVGQLSNFPKFFVGFKGMN